MARNILYAAVEIFSYDVGGICLIWEERKNDTLFKQCGIIILTFYSPRLYIPIFYKQPTKCW